MALVAQAVGAFRATPETVTLPHLVECRDCGLFQTVPALAPGAGAQCSRCGAGLRRARRDPLGLPLALVFTAWVLFGIAAGMTMLSVSAVGIFHNSNLLSGPEGLEKHGLWELAAVVLFTTVIAPMIQLAFFAYVLLGLRMARPPRHLRTIFGWTEKLRPWSMIEVFLLGVFVAYVKLQDMVHIEVGPALYALAALMLALVALNATLDPHAVWEEMERRGLCDYEPRDAGDLPFSPTGAMIGCHDCGLVSRPTGEPHERCRRCDSPLHARKPNAIGRAWAFSIAALVLYIPANVYPVLTVIQLGSGAPSTILGGVEELLVAGQWPLALLVFFASIAVPCLKLLCLGYLLISTQNGSKWRLRDRTVLYRMVNAVGRWSMIDIFMTSILVALVQFGSIVTIDANGGAIAFASVVILTMFAAESFDPRVMWDVAGRNDPKEHS